ncbi:hypothetical protein DAPPUDRAFT_269304 [Daphnia pulex]|uniref:Uncharacterized protein n=1 Tax=Daphnia pulex TaxID=6669 RepID=E9HZ60_DAPPU|nr:hypothetical protein DAPPUDRAFT_269304 [Daphnia pulex]|eukprot:EFX62971.1 hypothetical protein DAPPUDRAFT_269304 [Daphnia pulex]
MCLHHKLICSNCQLIQQHSEKLNSSKVVSITCCSARPPRKLFPEHTEKEKDKESSGSSGRESPGSSVNNTNMSEDVWLECDDEVIHVLRMRELEDLLSRKSRASALTPMLLFLTGVGLLVCHKMM